MNELQNLRRQVDQLDTKILPLLRKRAELSREIGEIKRNQQLPLTDPQREQQILEKCLTAGERHIYQEILKQSRKLQS